MRVGRESFNVYETELTTGHCDGDQLFYTLQILLLQQKTDWEITTVCTISNQCQPGLVKVNKRKALFVNILKRIPKNS